MTASWILHTFASKTVALEHRRLINNYDPFHPFFRSVKQAVNPKKRIMPASILGVDRKQNQ